MLITGTTGNDLLTGTNEDDVLNPLSGADTIDGGAGNDLLKIDKTATGNRDFTVPINITYNSPIGTVTGGSSDGTSFQNIETVSITGLGTCNIDISAANSSDPNAVNIIEAGFGNHVIVGSTLSANKIRISSTADEKGTLTGGAGNDTIEGGKGDDTIFGGAGDDIIVDTVGNNIINPGTGADKINLQNSPGSNRLGISGQGFAYNTRLVINNPGDTADTSLFYPPSLGPFIGEIVGGSNNGTTFVGSDARLTPISSIELTTGSGNDNIACDGGTSNDLIHTGAGNDKITSPSASGAFYGDAGDDFIRLSSSAGTATAYGGDGNDIIYAKNAYGDAGDDFMYGTQGNDQLFGGLGTDNIEGGIGNDTLYGDEGDDGLAGQEGDDLLIGGDGNDRLYGWLGNDVLVGGDGNDSLYGDDGNDILAGGAGADVFNFGYQDPSKPAFSSLGKDTITDFQGGVDKIQLQSATFISAFTGFGVSLDIVATDDLAGQSSKFIVYSQSTGNLFYNANGAAAGLGNDGAFAQLIGGPVIAATDFTSV